MSNDYFKNIPLDRNDEGCIHCGHGILRGIPLSRRVDRNHVQDLWECCNCHKEVVTIDEDKDQPCPTCGTPDVLTETQLKPRKLSFSWDGQNLYGEYDGENVLYIECVSNKLGFEDDDYDYFESLIDEINFAIGKFYHS